MKALIAVLLLGSVTSASAAGSDIHEAVPQERHVMPIHQTTGGYGDAFKHVGIYFGRGAAGVGHW
jgi:hypothetical protein